MATEVTQKPLTPKHQAIRALVAGLDETQFAALKASLEQSRAAIDGQLAALDAAREQLLLRKQQLDAVLERFNAPKGLDKVRDAMLKGERLGATLAVKEPKEPKPATPSRRTTRGGTRTRTGGTTPRD